MPPCPRASDGENGGRLSNLPGLLGGSCVSSKWEKALGSWLCSLMGTRHSAAVLVGPSCAGALPQVPTLLTSGEDAILQQLPLFLSTPSSPLWPPRLLSRGAPALQAASPQQGAWDACLILWLATESCRPCLPFPSGPPLCALSSPPASPQTSLDPHRLLSLLLHLSHEPAGSSLTHLWAESYLHSENLSSLRSEMIETSLQFAEAQPLCRRKGSTQ